MTNLAHRPVIDFDQSPFLVLWELTRACLLACRHCRAQAIRQRNVNELTFAECIKVLDQLEEFGRPLIVFTGGDPAQRADLYDLIKEAGRRGFKSAVTPSATPVMTQDVVEKMADAGVDRLAISIDGADSQTHDAFRRVRGSFDWSKSIIDWAHKAKLPVQINTTICRHNLHQFDKFANLAEELGAVLWSVFFLVPTGRASQDMQINASEAEDVLQRMAQLCRTASYDVKATAAPHFRRVLIEQYSDKNNAPDSAAINKLNSKLKLGALRSYQSVNDGRGLIFISHTGDILPSGFLPLAAGNVRNDSIVSVYRKSELFKSLRNPELLKGKCGTCSYRQVCGGSRARAFAETGDYLAEDSLCSLGI
ncbi:MAG: TIGR04053 family radical SAM/SPASM domain-containing protein [Candidatus Obscuribacterales bacterium]|nr:TIGR04053 family radical SAM/SPASM domain-containing protein [Candidatus Obscuribacterales bacterium]